MAWQIEVAPRAEKQLTRLPRNRQLQIGRAIEEIKTDPLQGDVQTIKSGRFKGARRKRVGRYRIVFSTDSAKQLVQIAAILPRTEKTYH